jgi:hypothetical protein
MISTNKVLKRFLDCVQLEKFKRVKLMNIKVGRKTALIDKVLITNEKKGRKKLHKVES